MIFLPVFSLVFCPSFEFHTLTVVLRNLLKQFKGRYILSSGLLQPDPPGLNMIVDLAFIDFTCSSDFVYKWRNWIKWGKTRAFKFLLAFTAAVNRANNHFVSATHRCSVLSFPFHRDLLKEPSLQTSWFV